MNNGLLSCHPLDQILILRWRSSIRRPHVAVDIVTTSRSGGVYLAHHLLLVNLQLVTRSSGCRDQPKLKTPKVAI